MADQPSGSTDLRCANRLCREALRRDARFCPRCGVAVQPSPPTTGVAAAQDAKRLVQKFLIVGLIVWAFSFPALVNRLGGGGLLVWIGVGAAGAWAYTRSASRRSSVVSSTSEFPP